MHLQAISIAFYKEIKEKVYHNIFFLFEIYTQGHAQNNLHQVRSE
jgi:hypothetical protein